MRVPAALAAGAAVFSACLPCAVALMGANAMQGSVLDAHAGHDVAPASALVRRTRSGAKSIFVTMTFPDDDAPMQIMLPHQLREVTQSENSSLDVVIVDNRPPDIKWSPQYPYLDQLRHEDSEWVRVVPVRYGRDFDDPAFLARFYTFPQAGDPEGMTVRKLSHQMRVHEQTNLMGMLTAMAQCLDAEPSVEICMYMDPDIFVYRDPGGPGLLDLAPAIFEENPNVFLLEPPLLCERTHVAVDRNGVCQVGPPLIDLSQRHLIFHRARLTAALPFVTDFDMVRGNFAGTFENILTRQTVLNRTVASMMCGSETVVTHPSVGGTDEMGHLSGQDHFKELARFGPDKPTVPGFDATYVKGLEVFLDRWEAGDFKTERSFSELEGNGDYTSGCLAMRPSKQRVDAGLAY